MKAIYQGKRSCPAVAPTIRMDARAFAFTIVLAISVTSASTRTAKAQTAMDASATTAAVTTSATTTTEPESLPTTFASSILDPLSEPDSTSPTLTSFDLAGSTSADPTDLDSEPETTAPAPLQQVLKKSMYWGEVGDRGGLSLEYVMSVAVRANPNLGTYIANRAAAQAELIRALEYPNPEVEFDFGRETTRESDDSGGRPSRFTYEIALTQPIEMPGKRLARQVEAEAGFAVVDGERREFLATLRADVIESYYTVQYHSALERFHSSVLEVANRLLEIAEIRVDIGEAGRIELLNARVEVLKAERERSTARRRQIAAKAALDALVAGSLDSNYGLADDFSRVARTHAKKSSIQAALSCHPRLVRLAAELEQRYASLDRARTEWWPDVNVGVRQSREFDSNSAAATIGMKIPLWNRNEGGVAKAQADAQATYNNIAIALTELRRDVEAAWQNLELAREQITSYKGGIRDASEEAVALAYEQYQLGATGFSDVLIARRNLQETQLGLIQALYDGAVAQARLERARGEYIDCMPSSVKVDSARPRSVKRAAVSRPASSVPKARHAQP